MKFKIIDWHKVTTFSEADRKGVGDSGKTLSSDNNDTSPPLYALNKNPIVTKESRRKFFPKNKKDRK